MAHQAPRMFPPNFVDRLFKFQGIKIYHRKVDDHPSDLFLELTCDPEFLCAASYLLGRWVLRNGDPHIIVPKAEWFQLAFPRFCEWTETEKVTTAFIDHNGYVQNITYATLWEVGVKFEAPKFQNAVVRTWMESFEVDANRALDLSGFDWLCERHRLPVERLKEHVFFHFLARMVMYASPSGYWTRLVERGGFTARLLAGWMSEKYREQFNVWKCDPRAGADRVVWELRTEEDVECPVVRLMDTLTIDDD